MVKNNTHNHISGVHLLMRYTDAKGAVIKERRVDVPCSVKPGGIQRVAVRSFDQEKAYYYRYGNKPRLRAKPFDVAVRLLGYDVMVTR